MKPNKGIIELDSEFAKTIGFTSDKFDGYLWYDGKRILISMIISLQPGQGHLTKLFEAIEKEGYKIAVPSPLWGMEDYLAKRGYKPHWEKFTEPGITDIEVWEKHEKKADTKKIKKNPQRDISMFNAGNG